MPKLESEDRSITIRILRSLIEEVHVHIKHSGRYTNDADFVRVAVRELLDREGKIK